MSHRQLQTAAQTTVLPPPPSDMVKKKEAAAEASEPAGLSQVIGSPAPPPTRTPSPRRLSIPTPTAQAAVANVITLRPHAAHAVAPATPAAASTFQTLKSLMDGLKNASDHMADGLEPLATHVLPLLARNASRSDTFSLTEFIEAVPRRE